MNSSKLENPEQEVPNAELMSSSEPAAFWSYSHEDDAKAGGAILKLARLISDEYSLLRGEELQLFIDTDVKWGEEWRQRIDNALVATTFFIPVITPRYFTRSECLRELFEFVSYSSELGVRELVCPILFVPVDGLTEDNQEPAKAQIARAQYIDWTELRLQGVGSPSHVQAVHKLATRLGEVADRVAERQISREAEDATEEVKASFAETLEVIRALIPRWMGLVEDDSVVREQFLAADLVLEEQRRKAKRGPAGARFIVAAKQVQEYMPLIQRRIEIEEQIMQTVSELSPLFTRMFELVKEHPEEKGVADEVWKEFIGAGDAYIQHDPEMLMPVSVWAKQHSHETRGMLTLAKACERKDRMAQEVSAQLLELNRSYMALGRLDRPESTEPSAVSE